YDYGARIYNPRLGRFLSEDRLAANFPANSPYVYAGNTPISGVDKDGDSLYILTYVTGYGERGDKMFEAAASTRKFDIEHNPMFDSHRDKVVVIAVKDVSDIKEEVEMAIGIYANYGKTAEFGIWSHAAYDGPAGSVEAARDRLSDVTKNPKDNNQMTLAGWGKIDFNWSPKGGRAYFLGCNTGAIDPHHPSKPSFTTALSALPNLKDVSVWGQTSTTHPSIWADRHAFTIWQDKNDYLPVTNIYGDIAVKKTYLVGASLGQGRGAYFLNFGGAPADPMRVSINGNGSVAAGQFQPGDRR
ncbi:MAG: hypothetical protein JST22_13980, partial [Bacteroidetes bacterium]|nr:hypothetical protein [Bacteroidota bacterium]